MTEDICYQMPYILQNLFATIVVFCNPDYPKELWKQLEESITEDINKLPNIDLKKIDILFWTILMLYYIDGTWCQWVSIDLLKCYEFVSKVKGKIC